MKLIHAESLNRYVSETFRKAGAPEPAAQLVSGMLVAANLRGVDSHGVQLVPLYIEQIKQGNLNPTASGRVTSDAQACVSFDAECGFGAVAAAQCCDFAIQRAEEYGVGYVIATNSNHFGAAAYWGSRIAATGKVGIVLCNASPTVAPWQARKAALGTNPICVAVPGPWLLDMATSAVALNRIYAAASKNQPEIPEGWALNASGGPALTPEEGMRGTVCPLGGSVAGYKGSGLAAAVEILGAVLGGGPTGQNVGSMRTGGRMNVSQTFIAVDIKRFVPVEEFERRMESYTAALKSLPPAEGFDEVMVAGDPQWRIESERTRQGIPIPDTTWDLICRTAAKLGVTHAPEVSTVD